MGRPYASELKKFGETYDWANKTPINNLIEFVKRSLDVPLYVVGSGGSFTATTFTSILHQNIGMVSRCITPLEFLGYGHIQRDVSILIITASGRNSDILYSFQKAVESEPKNLMVICASTGSSISVAANKKSNVGIVEFDIPSGKDGFLATNSLIATVVWILRAYVEAFGLQYKIPPTLSELVHPGYTQDGFIKKMEDQFKKIREKQTLIVLYDNWGKAAAVDIESKLIEAGLVNVQLADYRNFGHGRHNWLDKNKENTAIVALVTKENKKLANKTIHLIPKHIPTVEISTDEPGPLGGLALLVKAMYVVNIIGEFRKIDPGKPGSSRFGRKIYHLKPTKNMPIRDGLSKIEYFAIQRRFPHLKTVNDYKSKINSLRIFTQSLQKTKFGGIVFDYDGTLCDPRNRFNCPSKEIGLQLANLLSHEIIIGIATGRGKSVRKELQKIIPKKYWSKVLIGYYNCAEWGLMDDENIPNIKAELNPKLKMFLQILREYDVFNDKIKITERPLQVSVESSNLSAIELIKILQSIHDANLHDIQIVESTHSVDILAPKVSKLILFRMIERQVKTRDNEADVLCVGDKGAWPGNDFELLSTKYSLSVDEVSPNPSSCWNFIEPGHKGEKGVIDYLQMLKIEKDYFRLDAKRLM